MAAHADRNPQRLPRARATGDPAWAPEALAYEAGPGPARVATMLLSDLVLDIAVCEVAPDGSRGGASAPLVARHVPLALGAQVDWRGELLPSGLARIRAEAAWLGGLLDDLGVEAIALTAHGAVARASNVDSLLSSLANGWGVPVAIPEPDEMGVLAVQLCLPPGLAGADGAPEPWLAIDIGSRATTLRVVGDAGGTLDAVVPVGIGECADRLRRDAAEHGLNRAVFGLRRWLRTTIEGEVGEAAGGPDSTLSDRLGALGVEAATCTASLAAAEALVARCGQPAAMDGGRPERGVPASADEVVEHVLALVGTAGEVADSLAPAALSAVAFDLVVEAVMRALGVSLVEPQGRPLTALLAASAAQRAEREGRPRASLAATSDIGARIFPFPTPPSRPQVDAASRPAMEPSTALAPECGSAPTGAPASVVAVEQGVSEPLPEAWVPEPLAEPPDSPLAAVTHRARPVPRAVPLPSGGADAAIELLRAPLVDHELPGVSEPGPEPEPEPPPPALAVARGIVVATLVATPVAVLPLLLAGHARAVAWLFEGLAAMLAAGYVSGRIASARLARFNLRARLGTAGMLLANPVTTLGLVLLLAGAGVVLAPSNLDLGGSRDTPKVTGGSVPHIRKASVDRAEGVVGGPAVNVGELRIQAADQTAALSRMYSQMQRPPGGFHWVIVRVVAVNRGATVDVGRSSVRLVDADGRVYLPDIGEGVNNAPRGMLRRGRTAFWTAGFLVPRRTRAERIEVIPSAASTTMASLRLPSARAARVASPARGSPR